MNATAFDTANHRSMVTAHTPAKINLTLRVLDPRDDGYHNLHSLVMGVDINDRIVCTQAQNPGIELICSEPSLNQPDNLVIKAAELLARICDVKPSLIIKLDKKIPIAAGMGGGSSDAAAVLRLCNELWELNLSANELAQIGLELGSDVPLFFSLPVALITGRGELVEPARMKWSGWVLLVQTGDEISTARVYQDFHKKDSMNAIANHPEKILQATSADEIMEMTFNDLALSVFRQSSQVADVYQKLKQLSIGIFQVTGAGSVLYQLFDHQEAATETAHKIEKGAPGVNCCVAAAPVEYTQDYSEEETWKSQMFT